MYRIMETGCAKWIMIRVDGSVGYTSNSDDATIFEQHISDVFKKYPAIERYKKTLHISDSF